MVFDGLRGLLCRRKGDKKAGSRENRKSEGRDKAGGPEVRAKKESLVYVVWCSLFFCLFRGASQNWRLGQQRSGGSCRGIFSLATREIEPDQAARRKKKL